MTFLQWCPLPNWIHPSVIERCMEPSVYGINLWIDLPWTIEQLYHCPIWIIKVDGEEKEQDSMITWNCQKVNHSNSALKPLPRLHNVPKVAYVWDILIFQAFGTSWSTGKFQVAYLWLETIEENLRKCTKIDPLRIPFDTLTPQLYPRTLPNTLRHLKLFPMSPRSGPDHSHALVRQLESQRVWISIKFLQCWPTFSSSNKPHETPQ